MSYKISKNPQNFILQNVQKLSESLTFHKKIIISNNIKKIKM